MNSLLEFKKVSKFFGDVRANDQVSFQVDEGSIHALVGENGAGKSTIMKILFGLYQADEGEIFLRGKILNLRSPLHAKDLGLGMIHQHFMLADNVSALDHLILEEQSHSGLWKKIDRKQKLQAYQKLSEQFHMPVPWEKNIEDLTVGVQQRIEILKLLNNKADILILDEPTAVLAPQEIEKFFSQIKALKAQGKTILIVTHKLKEVFAIADAVTVFRHGRSIASKKIQETSIQEISELILGQKILEQKIKPGLKKEVLLELRSVSLENTEISGSYYLQDLNLQIHHGEILGIAGVEGNGQSELIQLLISPTTFKNHLKGQIFWKQRLVNKFSAKKMRNQGFRFLPEDRLHHGSLLLGSVAENFLFGQQRSPHFQKWGFLKKSHLMTICLKQMKRFDVRPLLPKASFQQLSGGNQQKLVVSREIYQSPELLLAAQPTRGVDIGAGQKIHHSILAERDRGAAVILISSELDEVMKLSDRILVMYKGKIAGEISNWSQLSEDQQQGLVPEIGRWMVGGNSQVIQ